MKKPKFKKYILKSEIIGMIIIITCLIISIFILDEKNTKSVKTAIEQMEYSQCGLIRNNLLSSDPGVILSENIESDEYGVGLARIDMSIKMYASTGAFMTILHDREGNVISDPSKAVFIRVHENNENGNKSLMLESEYTSDWEELFKARDEAYDKYIRSKMKDGVITYVWDEEIDEDARVIDSVEIRMDEIYVRGGSFIPGRVHLVYNSVASSRSDGVMTEILSKDMTPDNLEDYEKITKTEGRYKYDDEYSQPNVYGIDKDSDLWKDYEYFIKYFYKEFEFDDFSNETYENVFQYSFDREFLHHLNGSIRGINVDNNRFGAEYNYVTFYDYSIFKSLDDLYISHFGDNKYVRIFGEIIVPICLIVFMLFVIGYMRYLKKKSSYDMYCYRMETTNAMAHDLKTPLAAISGYAENLVEQVHVDKREYYAKSILSNVEYMDKMIHDILELSKSEDARQEINAEEIELAEIVDDEINSLSSIISERELSVSVLGDCALCTDKKMITSLVDNLVSNAVRYAKEKTEITIILADKKTADVPFNGKGMLIKNTLSNPLQKTVEELRQPYVKGDDSRGSRSGSGVGLTIVENVAKKLRCKVVYDVTAEEFSVKVMF